MGPAHEYVQRALSPARDGPSLFLLGGVALSLDLDYDTALASLAEARAQGFPESLVEFESGLAYLTSGRLQEAINRFDSALRLGAGDNQPAAHVWRAHAYFAGGRYEPALRAAEEAVVQAAGTGDYMHGPASKLVPEADRPSVGGRRPTAFSVNTLAQAAEELESPRVGALPGAILLPGRFVLKLVTQRREGASHDRRYAGRRARR